MKKFILAALMVLSSQLAFAATELTEANFRQEVEAASKDGGTVVIKFYATWCGACKQYAPAFDQAEKDLAGKATFFQIDVDKSPRLSASVQAIPTTLIGKGRNGVALRGALPVEKLKEAIARIQSAK